MTTTTSSSKKARLGNLYRIIFRRNFGYLGLVSVLTFLLYPLQYMMEVFKPVDLTGMSPEMLEAMKHNPFLNYDVIGRGLNHTALSMVFFGGLMLIAPIAFSLLLNQYMHNKKAVDVYHSLPVRRETLLCANVAVGMSYLAIPAIASSLIVTLVQIGKFGFHPKLLTEQLIELGGWMICSFMIYMIVTFACVLSGTVFNSLIYSGILLAFLPTICGLHLLLSSTFLFGYALNERTLWLLTTLSPVLLMPFRMSIDSDLTGFYPGTDSFSQFALNTSHIAIFVYLVLAFVLLLVCSKLYYHRPSEVAENTSSKGILPIITKLFVTFTVGILTGLLFWAIFSSNAVGLVWTVIGAAVANLITEIILNRGFKTLVKSLPAAGAMLLLPLLYMLIFMNGAFGCLNRVPEPEKVLSIEIEDYTGLYGNSSVVEVYSSHSGNLSRRLPLVLEDPESIAAMIQVHKGLISNYDPIQNTISISFQTKPEASIYSYTKFTYHLKNGKTLSRQYRSFTPEQANLFAKICTNPNSLAQSEAAFFAKPEMIEGWSFADPFGVKSVKKDLSEAQSQQLLDAIRADLLTLSQTDGFLNPQPGIYATITFSMSYPSAPQERYLSYSNFVVNSPKQQTYQLLEQMGILKEISVDLKDCYAVGLVCNSYTSQYQRHSGLQALFPSENMSDPFDLLQNRAQAYQQNIQENPQGDYERVFVIKDPAQIKLLAAQVVSTQSADEPVVFVSFYFNNTRSGPSTLMLPYSRLPKALQEKLLVW